MRTAEESLQTAESEEQEHENLYKLREEPLASDEEEIEVLVRDDHIVVGGWMVEGSITNRPAAIAKTDVAASNTDSDTESFATVIEDQDAERPYLTPPPSSLPIPSSDSRARAERSDSDVGLGDMIQMRVG